VDVLIYSVQQDRCSKYSVIPREKWVLLCHSIVTDNLLSFQMMFRPEGFNKNLIFMGGRAAEESRTYILVKSRRSCQIGNQEKAPNHIKFPSHVPTLACHARESPRGCRFRLLRTALHEVTEVFHDQVRAHTVNELPSGLAKRIVIRLERRQRSREIATLCLSADGKGSRSARLVSRQPN
jgi:hypothetical protein